MPEIVSASLRGQNGIYKNTVFSCLLHCVCICSNGAKAMMSKATGALAWTQAMELNHRIVIIFLTDTYG